MGEAAKLVVFLRCPSVKIEGNLARNARSVQCGVWGLHFTLHTLHFTLITPNSTFTLTTLDSAP